MDQGAKQPPLLRFKYSEDDIAIDESATLLTNIKSASFKNNTCFIGNWIELSDGTEATADTDNATEMENKYLTIELLKLSSESCFFIGLAPSDEQTANVSMEECCANSYGFCGNGRIYVDNKELMTVDECSEGDTLQLTLNAQKRCLTLRHCNENASPRTSNGEVTLFENIEPARYKFAVSLCYSGDQCRIVEHNIGDRPRTPTPPPTVETEETEAIATTPKATTESPKETDEILASKREEEAAVREARGAAAKKEGSDNGQSASGTTGCSCIVL